MAPGVTTSITLGGNLYWPLMLLMSGIVMAVTPSVSQLHGEGMAWTRPAMFIGLRFGVRSPNKCPTVGAFGFSARNDFSTSLRRPCRNLSK